MSALENPWQKQGAFLSLRTRKHSSTVLTTEFRSGSPDENANGPIPTGRINERIVGIHDFDSTPFIAVLLVLLGPALVSLTISMYRKWALWSVLVVTGLLVANFSASILTAFGIKDAVVTRGLGIGAAAHGLGTAAFVNEKDAFPFAAASTVVAVSVMPILRRILLQIALGW